MQWIEKDLKNQKYITYNDPKRVYNLFSFYRMYGLFISHPLNFIIFLLALVFAKVLTDNLSYMC